jgi:actin-related protein
MEVEFMSSILFDRFNVPAVILASPSVLALVAAEVTTGLSVHFHNDSIYVSLLVDLKPVQDAVRFLPDVGQFFANLTLTGIDRVAEVRADLLYLFPVKLFHTSS